jgi:tRNA pseudouridine32 synthase / 23S rRNA pseudouridine746 synthase
MNETTFDKPFDKPFDTPQKFEFTVTKPEQSALELLFEGTGISKQRIKDAMNKGAVWWTLKGKVLRMRRATKMLQQGSKIQFFYDPQVLALKPKMPELIHDAVRYSIWFKPAGMLAQGSQWGDHCSILRWVEVNGQLKQKESKQGESQRECFLVHRLDADAQGLMMIAHDSQSAAKLSHLFQSRDMCKSYQARATGDCNLPEEGLTISEDLDGKSAKTHLKTMSVNDHSTLLDIQIETGRKHQIRRHLAGLGHPIIGDRLYGNKSPEGLQLLAYKLEFTCPFSQQLLIIELPKEKQFLSE